MLHQRPVYFNNILINGRSTIVITLLTQCVNDVSINKTLWQLWSSMQKGILSTNQNMVENC